LASTDCEAKTKKIPLGGKKDEESSSKEKESYEKEVNKTLKLGAKTEIYRAAHAALIFCPNFG